MWLVAALGGVVAVLTGAVPLDTAGSTLGRLAPILVFLVAVTVLAELADGSGLFDVAAHACARWGRGSGWRLWLLVVALATAATVLLSLDTTAVLLTPVVLALADQLGLPPLGFAMTTVWLANTASLLLPVSNLTNLLAQDSLELSTRAFAAASWPAALAAVVVTVAVLGVRYRRTWRTTYDVPPRTRVEDRVLLGASAAACLLLGPLVLLGLPVAGVALVLASGLALVFAVRRRAVLRVSLVPWRLVLLVAGLFLVVAAARAHGLDAVLAGLTGSGDDAPALLRLSGVAAAGANLVNNLPAYAALEPAAGGVTRMLALLVGVNTGPLVLLWGSLATLLWRERCRARGLEVGWREFATTGLLGVPVVVVAGVLALAVAG
ncbi:MAG: arsenic transporter [Frankiales bacterium]|nr:arsenic transporter [Frankiales bacterium]